MADDGRAFLITGATGGAGEFVARRLLARGDRLLLTGRNSARLDELKGELGSNGEVDVLAVDVTAPDQADAAAARAKERFGRLDGLVSLVGRFQAGTPVVMAGDDVYLELYRANVLSAAMASRAVLRQIQGPAWFVYVTSLLAKEPMPSMGPYAASKAALVSWARAFSREVKDRGVHVNVIMGSLIDTPKNREEQPGADYSKWVPAERIADVIAFLTSPEADGLHGSVIPVLGTFALDAPAAALGRLAGAPGGPGGPPAGVDGPPGGPPPGIGGPPPGVGGPPGGPPAATGPKRFALLYPFKPGMAEKAEQVFREGGDPPPMPGGQIKLVSTTVFRKNDTVVRVFEIDADLDEAIDHLVQAAELGDVGRQLKPMLDEDVDLTTHEGLRQFFESQMMELITHREVPPWVRAGAAGPPAG